MNKTFNNIWMVVAVIAIAASSVVAGSSPVMMAASLVGIIFVIGVSRGWVHCQFFGAILAGFIAYFSYQAGFYGNMLVNALYVLPISILGWYHWRREGERAGTVKSRLTYVNKVRVSIATLSVLCVSLLIAFATQAALPVHDALSTTMLVIATFLLAVGVKEQWYFWIPYNALEVFMWFTVISGNPEMLAVLAMRVVFLINSIIGWVNWRKA